MLLIRVFSACLERNRTSFDDFKVFFLDGCIAVSVGPFTLHVLGNLLPRYLIRKLAYGHGIGTELQKWVTRGRLGAMSNALKK